MALDEQLRELADRVPPAPAGDPPALFRRGVRRRRVRQTSVAVLVLAVVGAGVLSLVEQPATPEITDVPPNPSPTPTATDTEGPERSADANDPDRIACEPTGCEVWRRPLDGSNHVPLWVDGPPVVIEDDGLVGIDLQTGEVRWEVRVGDELRARPDGPLDQRVERIGLAGNDEVVALATTRGVQLVSQDGDARWARALPVDEGTALRWLHATDEFVLIVHETAATPADAPEVENGGELPVRATVTVLDARDGEVMWSDDSLQRVVPLPALADEQRLVLATSNDGSTVSALELPTGDTRYELPVGPDRWPVHTGDVLMFGAFAGTESAQLYDASDGRDRAKLSGTARAVLDLDDRAVVLLAPDGIEAETREVVAVESDGSVAWRQPVAAAAETCCPSILDLGDGTFRVSDGPAAPAIVVDASDGAVLPDDPLAAAVADLDTVQQLGRHLLASPATPDDPTIVLFDRAGRELRLTGQVGMNPRIGEQTPDLIVVANPRELVAVRFP